MKLSHDVIITGSVCEKIPNCNNIISRNGWKHYDEKIDVCYHLAANNNTLCYDKNLIFKQNICDSVRMIEKLINKNKCTNFVIASSCAIYGKNQNELFEDQEAYPVSYYGESKLKMESILTSLFSNKAKLVFLRYSNVYGPDEYHKNSRASMVFKIIQCFLKNKRPNLFEFGQQERDWVYIKDVVQANILGMKIPAGIYNCGYGESREFNEVLHIINGFKLKSKKFIANYIRNPYPENYQSTTNVNIDKLKNQGYKPVYNLEKGIKDIIL